MIETNWIEWEDVNGKWKSNGDILLHVVPSQKWIDEHPAEESPKEPTETEVLTDYLVDVDYRLTLVELGLI